MGEGGEGERCVDEPFPVVAVDVADAAVLFRPGDGAFDDPSPLSEPRWCLEVDELVDVGSEVEAAVGEDFGATSDLPVELMAPGGASVLTPFGESPCASAGPQVNATMPMAANTNLNIFRLLTHYQCACPQRHGQCATSNNHCLEKSRICPLRRRSCVWE